MNHSELDWSSLRVVLAVAQEGSLRAAAKALRVSHPTVSRHVAELQENLGVKLFHREGRQFRLSPAGEDLAETAARIQVEVDGLGRRIAGRDHRLQGLVRVALSPSMMAALTPALPAFSQLHPGVELELVTSLSMASLTRREADVAIRFTDKPHETLVGRKVSVFEQAIYVARTLCEKQGELGAVDPRHWPWVDWDEAHRHHHAADWVRKNIPRERIVARCDSSLALYQLVRAGVGVGFAPTMLAGPDPDVERLVCDGDWPVFCRPIWVLTHADLRTTGRIQATVRWLHQLLAVDGGGTWPGLVSVPRPLG